jgi:outer membrane protein assembly factor BamB
VDVSRYEATIKRSGTDAMEVKMEVVGSPEFFPLTTVDLLVAGQLLTVLDKAGKKLWESKLNFEIVRGFGERSWESELVAAATAPAVERGNVLYFFDKGVLTCFELATGNARWRQPTVGVSKLMFDDEGILYVDGTAGSVDSIRYSQQIDVSQKNYPVIMKIDPKNGKILWRSEQNGRLSHVFGKLIYTIEWHGGDEDEEPSGYGLPGLQTPPHIRIRRLSAGDGRPKWEYYQKRAPINVDIQKNMIQLVFKREMQVLKFIAL